MICNYMLTYIHLYTNIPGIVTCGHELAQELPNEDLASKVFYKYLGSSYSYRTNCEIIINGIPISSLSKVYMSHFFTLMSWCH